MSKVSCDFGKFTFPVAFTQNGDKPGCGVFVALRAVTSAAPVTQRDNVGGYGAGAIGRFNGYPMVSRENMPQAARSATDGATMLPVIQAVPPVLSRYSAGQADANGAATKTHCFPLVGAVRAPSSGIFAFFVDVLITPSIQIFAAILSVLGVIVALPFTIPLAVGFHPRPMIGPYAVPVQITVLALVVTTLFLVGLKIYALVSQYGFAVGLVILTLVLGYLVAVGLVVFLPAIATPQRQPVFHGAVSGKVAVNRQFPLALRAAFKHQRSPSLAATRTSTDWPDGSLVSASSRSILRSRSNSASNALEQTAETLIKARYGSRPSATLDGTEMVNFLVLTTRLLFDDMYNTAVSIVHTMAKVKWWTVERVERVNPPTATGDLGFVLKKVAE